MNRNAICMFIGRIGATALVLTLGLCGGAAQAQRSGKTTTLTVSGGAWTDNAVWNNDAPSSAWWDNYDTINVGMVGNVPGVVTDTDGYGVGGILNVTDGATVNFNSSWGFAFYGPNCLNLDTQSFVNVTGPIYVRSEYYPSTENTVAFTNTPGTHGKVCVSTNSSITIGDIGQATLNIGAASSETHFGDLNGSDIGLLNIDGATIGFSAWDAWNRIRGTNGAVINIDGFALVNTTNAITLDNTSKINVGGSLYVRNPIVNITGASVNIGSDLFSDWGFSNFEVNVTQNVGQSTGMTLNGALSLENGGKLNLVFDAGSGAGDWIFRKHEASDSLSAMISSGLITVSGAAYEIVNKDGYTTIQVPASVLQSYDWVGKGEPAPDNMWSTISNWGPTDPPTGGPNAAGAVVTFGNTGSQPTVDLGAADKTVGVINFSGQVAATLQSNPGSEVLSLKNTGGSTITVGHVTGANPHTDTISVPLELNNDLSIKVADSGDGLVIDHNIGQYGGSFGLTLAADNAGTVTLSGTNSYSGGTVVSGGTLVIGSAGALPSGRSLSIGSGGTLILGGGMAMGTAASAEPVPEPGTLALLAIAALAGLFAWRRRQS